MFSHVSANSFFQEFGTFLSPGWPAKRLPPPAAQPTSGWRFFLAYSRRHGPEKHARGGPDFQAAGAGPGEKRVRPWHVFFWPITISMGPGQKHARPEICDFFRLSDRAPVQHVFAADPGETRPGRRLREGSCSSPRTAGQPGREGAWPPMFQCADCKIWNFRNVEKHEKTC